MSVPGFNPPWINPATSTRLVAAAIFKLAGVASGSGCRPSACSAPTARSSPTVRGRRPLSAASPRTLSGARHQPCCFLVRRIPDQRLRPSPRRLRLPPAPPIDRSRRSSAHGEACWRADGHDLGFNFRRARCPSPPAHSGTEITRRRARSTRRVQNPFAVISPQTPLNPCRPFRRIVHDSIRHHQRMRPRGAPARRLPAPSIARDDEVTFHAGGAGARLGAFPGLAPRRPDHAPAAEPADNGGGQRLSGPCRQRQS